MNAFQTPSPLVPSLLASLCIAITACGGTGETTEGDEASGELPAGSADTAGALVSEQRGAPIATAILSPTEGSEVEGSVTFIGSDEGTRVTASVRGLTPGAHGFHIHENGDCSSPRAASADGHYAPDDTPHGAPSDPASERHAGDLGNLMAGEDGVAEYDRVDDLINVGDPNSILGRAVIVHEGRDDLDSQPSGDSGPRQACGVISIQGSTEVIGSEAREP